MTAAPIAPAQEKDPEKKDAEKQDINISAAADLKAAGFSGAKAKKVADGRPYKRRDQLVKKTIIVRQAMAEAKK